MNESEDISWEDRISRDFIHMTVQDDETGECWPIKMEETLVTDCPSVKSGKLHSTPEATKKWKIPQEYSLLGCSSSEDKTDVQPLLIKSEESASWSCEKEDEAGETVVVAKFPPVGKVPLFGRKRRRPLPSTAVKDAELNCLIGEKSTRKKRFLEGRGGILLLGRLILACLILLSPGYVLPLLLTVRTYCHMWKHGNGEHPEEDIVDPNTHVFGFLRTRAFLKYTCRFCRERIQSERMLRLHTMYGSAASPKLSSNVPVVEEESYGCNCPHH